MQLKGLNSKLAIIVMTNKQAKIQEKFSKKTKTKQNQKPNMSEEQQHVLWQINHCMIFLFWFIFILHLYLYYQSFL